MTGLSTHLCIGGPLDGQYRTTHHDIVSFVTFPDAVEYQLVWSRRHRGLVWWCNT